MTISVGNSFNGNYENSSDASPENNVSKKTAKINCMEEYMRRVKGKAGDNAKKVCPDNNPSAKCPPNKGFMNSVKTKTEAMKLNKKEN